MVANASTNMRNPVKDQVLQEEVDQVPEVHSIPHNVSEVHQALQAELTNHKFHSSMKSHRLQLQCAGSPPAKSKKDKNFLEINGFCDVEIAIRRFLALKIT